MRFLLLLSLVACDLQPPKQREVPRAAAPVTADAAGALPPADAGAVAVADARAPIAPPDADIEPTPECLDVAVDITEKLIQSAKDPAERAAMEQDRSRMVKTTSRSCTRNNWTDVQRKCFIAAKTKEAIDACAKDLPTAQPPPPAGGTGSAR